MNKIEEIPINRAMVRELLKAIEIHLSSKFRKSFRANYSPSEFHWAPGDRLSRTFQTSVQIRGTRRQLSQSLIAGSDPVTFADIR